jgi:methionyl-tRNA formyltransferase
MRLGVLCSGNLGFQILMQLSDKYSISFVLTDSNSDKIIEFCSDNAIPFFKGNPRNGNCNEFLEEKECEVLLSINYLFLIDEDIINFPKKYAINVHGSLLPKYRGRTPHVWAIINNEKKTGITAHLIDSGCDTGQIIEQIEVPIEPHDTGASILEKFNHLYWPLIEQVLMKIKLDQLTFTRQVDSKATYFGKRTPDDGHINWNWQKERINNWVRAQAHPYPGAFTYAKGNKLTIDRISFTDDGYDFQIANGTILSVNPLKVKAPNGVIQIDSFREALENLLITKMVLE